MRGIPVKTGLLWPFVAVILLGGGFLADRYEFLWMTGTFLVLFGVGGVTGWIAGLVDCHRSYEQFCILPPDGEPGARYVLVELEPGRWEWRKA